MTSTESKEEQLLRMHGGAVGLLVDRGAVDFTARVFTRVHRPVDTDEQPRILQASRLPGFQASGPLCTASLLRLRGETEDEGLCVVTAGHCVILDLQWPRKVVVVTNAGDLDGKLGAKDLVELDHVIHFETEHERDLAIVAAKDSRNGRSTLQVPPEALDDITPDEDVFVMGHNGGRPLQVFPAKVVGRIPEQGGRLRGLNLRVDPDLECLSGAPVFRWRDGDDAPLLLGVIQGSKHLAPHTLRDRARQLIDELAAHDGKKADEMMRLLDAMMGRDPEISLMVAKRLNLELQAQDLEIMAKGLGFCDNALSKATMVFLGGALPLGLYPA